MGYTDFSYCLLVLCALAAYYILPLNRRWTVLLTAGIVFYAFNDLKALPLVLLTAVFSFFAGKLLGRNKSKVLYICCAVISALPLLSKVILSFAGIPFAGWLVPLGLSFYSLQIISYLTDVYTGKISPQENCLKYILFITYFPQIIQGPIPRYEQLGHQLFEGHRFDEDKAVRGLQLIIWGYFLKLMIAEKAAPFVNRIFADCYSYSGIIPLLAAALFIIQLYADFLSCVTLSQGVSLLFGIEVADNFRRPVFAESISEFWRRWHLSLSHWLRDYVYFPLGGSRKGKLRKYLNIIVVFIISGLWHGVGINYLIWGLFHAFCQIAGELTMPLRTGLCRAIRMPALLRTYIRRFNTFLLVVFSMFFFRAYGTSAGLYMIRSLFMRTGSSLPDLFSLGIDRYDFAVLAASLIFLLIIETLQEKGISVCGIINKKPFAVRLGIYLAAFLVILVFGTYGIGFDSGQFIYGMF
ncbi:MAG: hypothetical protein K6D03_01435 [Solobacterium sp.]|nr:hypothetical protein [Solobacterium sp.]